MKPWKETSRSSKTITSSRRGLAATPSRLPVKAAFIYVSFSHFDYCKDYVDVSDIWCNQLCFPLLILFEHCVMMSMLCYCCVCELLILARTWFAFGLPSKTGCDIYFLGWFVFPSPSDSDFILMLTPACSVFKVVNFSFRLSTPL
jgi:hypothetical protein